MIDALLDFLNVVCRNTYNQYQNKGKHARRSNKYKKFVVKHGVSNLINVESDTSNLDNDGPQVPASMRDKKVSQMMKLILSQNKSVQDFINQLLKRLINYNDDTRESSKHLLLPLFVRDMNTLIKNYKYDPRRMMTEAFNYKSNNISIRKQQKCRNAV